MCTKEIVQVRSRVSATHSGTFLDFFPMQVSLKNEKCFGERLKAAPFTKK